MGDRTTERTLDRLDAFDEATNEYAQMARDQYGEMGAKYREATLDALDENNVSTDFYEALNDEVAELLEDAARRAAANDRKTVQPRDL